MAEEITTTSVDLDELKRTELKELEIAAQRNITSEPSTTETVENDKHEADFYDAQEDDDSTVAPKQHLFSYPTLVTTTTILPSVGDLSTMSSTFDDLKDMNYHQTVTEAEKLDETSTPALSEVRCFVKCVFTNCQSKLHILHNITINRSHLGRSSMITMSLDS